LSQILSIVTNLHRRRFLNREPHTLEEQGAQNLRVRETGIEREILSPVPKIITAKADE
jgi:hypothetical protein